jgi:hypothetical protein
MTMHRKAAIAIMALSLAGCFIVIGPSASAQPGHPQEQKKAQGPSRGGGNAVAPGGGGGGAVAPRGGARTVTPSATRTVTPREVRTVTPKATRTVTPREVRTVTPKATRAVTPQVVAPRVAPTVTLPSGGNARVVTAGRLRGVPVRGAGRTVISGHNFSAWRSGYRVRHGNAWRTFIALSALSTIAIGSSSYYPYAYIAAPEPYCEGLTADGCRLMWQEVETLEGDVVNQCVAYCPWQ